LRIIQQDYDGEESKKSPTYAVAKPLYLRPEVLTGEVALELADLLGGSARRAAVAAVECPARKPVTTSRLAG
jgi:hypothetical protein